MRQTNALERRVDRLQQRDRRYDERIDRLLQKIEDIRVSEISSTESED